MGQLLKPKELEKLLKQLQLGLKDSEELIRYHAAAELGELGSAAMPAVPALQQALGDRCHSVRRVAAWALTRIDPTALKSHPLAKKSLIEKIIMFCIRFAVPWRKRETFNPDEYLAEPLER